MSIIIQNLKKYYGTRLVLDMAHLEIPVGKITAVLGANGAGKSTLFRIIAGLDTQYTGEIRINDNQKWDPQTITMVFQKPYMLEGTVWENVLYPLKIRYIPKREAVAQGEALLALLNISHLKEQRAKKLSGGEMQKVNLARALIFQPSILILDEAMAGVDIHTIAELEDFIIQYNKTNQTTIIMSTHIQGQAEKMADHIVTITKL